MKLSRTIIVIVLFVVVLVALAVAAYSPHARSFGDAVSYLMFLREDGTTFAPGFTEAKFDRVQIGMSEEEVTNVLGDPLQKQLNDDKTYWRYSTGPSGGSYWFRVITFRAGRVAEKDAHYYAD